VSFTLTREHRTQIEEFRRQQQTGILVMLFTDLVGSTRLKQDLGDSRAVAITKQHHAVVRELLTRFPDSKEIDNPGDSFFVVFAKPSEAVRFGLLAQLAVRQMAAEIREPLANRIGIHAGEVFLEKRDGSSKPLDLFGIQVDSAARVMSLAKGSQVLVTRFVFDNARQLLRGEEVPGLAKLSWLSHGPYKFKGVEEPQEICEVGETSIAPLHAPPDSEKATRYAPGSSDQVLGWRPAVEQIVPNTQWVLESKLGEGGFGEVWLARHKTLREKRVFKFCFRADRVRSLKREVTLFRVLRDRVGVHPNIVAVREVFFDEPPYYIIMDYAEGEDLRKWLKTEGGVENVPLAVRLEIVAQMADALQAAHDAGIIHRDVKPSNIIVHGSASESVRAELTDFGIGQVVSQSVLAGMTRTDFTETGTTTSSEAGTMLYMAPEILAGTPQYKTPEILADNSASIRSDIYSLGVVLYQLVAGDLSRPVTAEWTEDVKNPLLRQDIARCLARNPQDRFAGAQALAKRLRALPEREKELERTNEEAKARERASYRKGVARASFGALAIVVIVAALALYAWRESKVAKATLSRSLFALGVRSIEGVKNADAVAYLAQSLSENPANQAALTRLATLLAYHSWMICDRIFPHKNTVFAGEFSPDGQKIITASWDGTARIWDAHTGETRSNGLLQHDGPLWSVHFSPDGQYAVTASEDNTARIWDVQSGKEIAQMRHSKLVWSAEYSPDGTRIVTASNDETARIWNATNWTSTNALPLTPPLLHSNKVLSAHFNFDGTKVITATADGTVRIFDGWTGVPLIEPLKLDEIILSAELSRDGKRILAGAWDTAFLWDAQSNPPRKIGSMVHKKRLRSVHFSPDGKYILTASDDQTARVWRAEDGQPFLKNPLLHDAQVWTAQFSHDGKQIVTGSADGRARIWNATSGEPLVESFVHGNLVRVAQFSPDGKQVLTASDERAQIWTQWGRPARPTQLRHADKVQSAEFSPDGRRVLTASDDKTARVWDTQTGQETLSKPLAHKGPVRSAKFNQAGTQIVTASQDTNVCVWDAKTGQLMRAPLLHDGSVWQARFSPDGNCIASFTIQTVFVWDLRTNRPPLKLHFGREVTGVEFSPDGKRIVTASSEKNAQVWDAQTGFPIGRKMWHGNGVETAVFSPDGKWVVTASDDDTAHVWDAATGGPLAKPIRHADTVRMAELSPNGKLLATGSLDSQVRVWDALTGHPLTKPLPLGKHPRFIKFSPDSRFVAAAAEDRMARVWDVETGLEVIDELQHGDEVATVWFSPGGTRLVTASDDHLARIWDLPPTTGKCPAWLLDLARVISRQSLNPEGVLEIIDMHRNALEEIRQELSRGRDEDHWVIWGQWLLDESTNRTISPFSKAPVSQ
jgi:WD40 repeat protein/class 3 adenylate cyclase/tRNA A-37 threonylcarbamoyl transferase component Bud32